MSSDGSLGVGDCLAALWAVPGWPVVLVVGAMELRLWQLGQPPGVECLVVRRLHQPLPELGAKFVCLLLSQPRQRPFGVDVEAQIFGVEVLQRAVHSCGATGQRHVGLSLLRDCAVQLAVRPLVGGGCLALVYGDCFGQDESFRSALLSVMSWKVAVHLLILTASVSCSAHHRLPACPSNLIQMSSTSPLMWASMCTTVPQAPFTSLSGMCMLLRSMTRRPTATRNKASSPPVFSGSAQTTSEESGAPVFTLMSTAGHW